MKKQIALALGGLTALAALFASPETARATSPAPCVANYGAIDLPSRSMSWGIYCPDGGVIHADTTLFYGSAGGVDLPDEGTRVLVPGETWTVWTQDNTHTGAADHGVLHIVQDLGGPAPPVLVHIVK